MEDELFEDEDEIIEPTAIISPWIPRVDWGKVKIIMDDNNE